MAEVASAGINLIRTGSAAWGPETAPGQIELERQTLDAAASHGLLGWLWLGDLTDLPARDGPDRSVRPRAAPRPGRERPQGASGARCLEGGRRAAEPRSRGRVDPPGGARSRLRAAEGARSPASARGDPGTRKHCRAAHAVSTCLRRHRHGRLPRLVSARDPRRGGEQGRLGRRRLGARDRNGCGAEAVLDHAPDRVDRRCPLAGSGRPSCRASRRCSRNGSWRCRRS